MCKSMGKGAMWPFGEISPKLPRIGRSRAFDGVPAPGTPRRRRLLHGRGGAGVRHVRDLISCIPDLLISNLNPLLLFISKGVYSLYFQMPSQPYLQI